MNNRYKRNLSTLISVFLVICIVCTSLLSVTAWAADADYSGKEILWSLNKTTGVMTVKGAGNMKNYNDYHLTPWYNDRNMIREIHVEEGVTEIGLSAFERCENLVRVTLPDTLTGIGVSAFAGCTSLEDIDIPQGVTRIGGEAFSRCSSLQSITIPGSVTSLGVRIFAFCTSLKNVVFLEGVTSIPEEMFYYSSALTHLSIPQSVTTVRLNALKTCTGLQAVSYAGDAQMWESITIQSGNDILHHAPKFYGHLTHTYSKETTAPTCTTAGLETSTCTVCGYTFSRVLSMIPHDFDESISENVTLIPPTITENGSKTVRCSRCDATTTTVLYDKTPKMILDDMKSYAGKQIEVSVRVENNPGLIAAHLSLRYDTKALTLVEVKNGNVFGENAFVSGNDLSLNPYGVLWEDGAALENHTANGNLVTFVFRVNDDARIGQTPITLTYNAGSTYNMDLEDVSFYVDNALLTLIRHTPGDADCDGSVDVMDIAKIMRGLADGWDASLEELNADVNDDGYVDMKDVVLLRRYLAGGWGVELK